MELKQRAADARENIVGTWSFGACQSGSSIHLRIFVVRSGELPDRQLKQMSCHTAQLGTVHNQCNSGQQLYTWLRSRLRHCPYSLIHIRLSLSLSLCRSLLCFSVACSRRHRRGIHYHYLFELATAAAQAMARLGWAAAAAAAVSVDSGWT